MDESLTLIFTVVTECSFQQLSSFHWVSESSVSHSVVIHSTLLPGLKLNERPPKPT